MTNAVSAALGGFAEVVIGASMERREGDAYAFNEPLLEGTLFNLEGNGSGDFVVAMMFLQPGRHAGSGGDVATILKEEETQHPGLKTHITDLMGSGDDIIPILADRFSECLASAAAASAGSI
ncbi:sirohydrochlorin cobaltochelatase [Sphaeroforma arctica JP610]|uniref:Sirohydrochlorin cobaltochelatase n=1 Tax=Sphaeroforma arctica JP610 TaxID=667725 RepID=A0A0L0FJH0_9EUKA|nr:sirohydrochlorin cobaltochelatase [Sphaeroforma arctica JP610]KNC76915.1 sirohydrochlorin cobaltochelatase [Sphaeroforma arctica JP610]|eukprot:XP_014150817.1 sirohydrochlorin cobaltochelatase [Sphaeroforma arctica JP610]